MKKPQKALPKKVLSRKPPSRRSASLHPRIKSFGGFFRRFIISVAFVVIGTLIVFGGIQFVFAQNFNPPSDNGGDNGGQNQPGPQGASGNGDQGLNIDQGIRNVDKGIRIDQGIRTQPMPGQPQGGPQGQGGQGGDQRGPGPGGPGQGPGPGQQGGQPGGGNPQNGPGPFGPGGPQNGGNFDMNNRPQPGDQSGQNQQGQPNQNQPNQQNQGPTDAERQAKQDAFDAQQKAQQARQFSQIKNQLKSFSSVLKRMTARIAPLEKQGLTIPEDVKSTIADSQKALDTILNATTMDDEGVQDALQTAQDSRQTIGDAMQKLDQLAQLPKMYKQVDSQIKKLDSTLTRDKKIAASLKYDVSGTIDAFSQAVSDLKASYARAKETVNSGDLDGGQQILQDEVFDKFNDLMQYDSVIQTLRNVKSQLTQMDRFTTQAKRALAAKEKVKEDTTEAQSALTDYLNKVNELKQLLSSKPINPDDLRDAVSNVFDARAAVEDALGLSQQNASSSSGPPTMNNEDLKTIKNFNLPPIENQQRG